MIATLVKVGLKGANEANEVANLVKVCLKYVKISTTFERYGLDRHARPKHIGSCRLDKPGRRRKSPLYPKCLKGSFGHRPPRQYHFL